MMLIAAALAGVVLLVAGAVGRGRLLDTYRRLPLELRDSIFAAGGTALMVLVGLVLIAVCAALVAAVVLGVALLFTVSPVAAIAVVWAERCSSASAPTFAAAT